jgi:hypothetical protein
MGVYYAWICRERKEFFDPGNLPMPQAGGDESERYGIKYAGIPHSAWMIGALCLGRWSGCQVKLVNDEEDDYEVVENATLAAEQQAGEADALEFDPPDLDLVYKDVTREALEDALRDDLIPDEALERLARIAGLYPPEQKISSLEEARRRLQEKYLGPRFVR